MSANQYLSYLLHKTELTDANAAYEILRVGCRDFGATAKSLSGKDLNKWINGKHNIPRWAILSSLVIALDHKYIPEKDSDWPDFVRSFYEVYKPDSDNSLIQEMKNSGIFKEQPPTLLINAIEQLGLF